MAMRLLDLFSGIGGFSYAAEKLIGGYETVAFCEMDEFCQKVLKKHWPQVPIFDDVRTIDAARLGRIDIVTGGYPCQPFSQAGRRQGEEDERHLWPEMLRIIKSCQPRYVLAENVAGHVTMGLDQVLTDLEDQGYTTRAIIVPACAKNAPHRRDRVWIIGQYVGYTEHNGSSATKIRGIDIEDAEWPQKRSQQTFQFERASKPRHYETMANTENGRGEQTEWQGGQGFRGRSENIGGSETEREKVDRADVANTKRLGWEKRAEKSEEFDRERSSDQSDNGSQGCTISNTDKDVANTFNKRSQGGLHRWKNKKRQDKQRHIGCSSTAYKQPNERAETVVGKLGDMVDGISRGLLRHFDREPDHIPRVTKGEKDRAKKLKALGNSIVPQVAAEILLAIRVSEESD
jgi:DNA (cytosine-5)-methyltransferase 1